VYVNVKYQMVMLKYNFCAELMFALIKKKKMEKNLDLSEIFLAYDKDKTGRILFTFLCKSVNNNNLSKINIGFVSMIQFKYVLNAQLELEIEFTERTAEFLGVTRREYQETVNANIDQGSFEFDGLAPLKPVARESENPFLRELSKPDNLKDIEPREFVNY